MKKAITYEAPELMVFEIHTAGTLCVSGVDSANNGYKDENDNIIGKDYHPIKFVKSYDLNNLPDEKIFVAELTPDDEEEL